MLHRVKVLLGLPHDTRVIKHNGYEPGNGDYIYYNPTADEEDSARKSYQQQLANDKSGTIHFRNSFLTPAEQDFSHPGIVRLAAAGNSVGKSHRKHKHPEIIDNPVPMRCAAHECEGRKLGTARKIHRVDEICSRGLR
jgi:hypothetical protein